MAPVVIYFFACRNVYQFFSFFSLMNAGILVQGPLVIDFYKI